MQWKRYPMGAHTDILNGFIRILVVKTKNRFEGVLFGNWASNGMLTISTGKTVDEAITKTEEWLKEQMANMFNER